MSKLTKEQMLEMVRANIKKMEDKSFNVFFYVIDTKNVPAGFMEYTYQTALTLKEKGYNVTMLHNEKDFVGVGGWMGEEYAALPHKNVEKTNVEVGPADFLFIPEILTSVMLKTKKFPCKRVVILQDKNFLTEMMPIGGDFINLGITDVITTTKTEENFIKDYFPNVRTHIVSPVIKSVYRPAIEPQKLIINIISKNQTDINRVIKPFYWKFPMYKWVSFRELRNLPTEIFANAVREAAITICIDDDTAFGYTILESMRCGTLTMAKIPDTLSDWMIEKDEDGNSHMIDSCIWFNDIDELPTMIASLVRTWTNNAIPDEVYKDHQKMNGAYTLEQQAKEVEDVYVKGLFEKREREFKEVEIDIEKGVIKTKSEKEEN